jgi:outer membrane protein assembly factor BamB
MAPTFVLGSEFTPDGLDIIVVGQKNGNLYALTAQAGTVLWTTVTGPDGVEGGLIWGIAVDDRAAYFTNVNSNGESYRLLNGTAITNSAFGAASLKDGSLLWLTATPRNHSSQIAPTIVNDLVLIGTTTDSGGDPNTIAPGLFTPLDKRTGKVLRVETLDAYFHGNLAAVHDYVMFGTGYGGSGGPGQAGSFQVGKLQQ